MKKIVLVFAFLLSFSFQLKAQWYIQSSGTNSDLFGISFTDLNNGFVVGSDGNVLKTTNGGNTWDSQMHVYGYYTFMGVSMVNETTNYIVGSDFVFPYLFLHVILKTSNNGINWVEINSGSLYQLYDISFSDSVNGTVVGQEGTILRTTDAGDNWNIQSSGISNNLYGCSIVDDQIGTAVGINGTILRTIDGGTSWAQQSGFTTEWLNKVAFFDTNNGFTVGVDGTILHTTNGGDNWELQSSGTTYHLNDVSFIDLNNVIVVGRNGTILKTTNSGITWTSQLSGTMTHLSAVFFIDENTGWIVGENGTILHTTNGGLPVELTSFTAIVSNSCVQLVWSTETELNNHGFEIERSIDKTKWRTIGFREGKGTTSEPQQYSYSDDLSDITASKLYYRLKQIDYNGSFEYSDVVEVLTAPTKFSLEQNYPNPFNPNTKISWQSPVSGWQTLKIYDVLGNEVATLVSEEKPAGNYEIEFDASNLSSGVYYYQLRSGSFVETKKMILLR